jgi:hypothetical protein
VADRERLELEIDANGMVSGRRVAVRELDEIKRASGETGKQLGMVDKVLAGLGTSSAALAPYLAAGAVALGGLAAAGLAAFAVLRQGVSDAAAAQRAQAQLAAGVASTGMAAGLTTNELIDLSGELQRLSGVEDDAIQKAQGVLLTFTKIGQEVFPAAARATLDMAARLGTDLGSAAIQVGKALNAPIEGITALSRAGIQFTDQQKDQIKTLVESGDVLGAQRIILAELETQFGGSAAAARNTFGGAIDAARHAAGDLSEELGAGLLPGLRDLVEQLVSVAESDEAVNLVAGLGAILGASIGSLGDFVRGIGEFADELAAIGPLLSEINPLLAFFVAASGLGAVSNIAEQLDAVGKAARFRAEIERNAQDLLAQAFGKGSAAAGGAGGLGDEGKKVLEQMFQLGERRLQQSERLERQAEDEARRVQGLIDGYDEFGATLRKLAEDEAALGQVQAKNAEEAAALAAATRNLAAERQKLLEQGGAGAFDPLPVDGPGDRLAAVREITAETGKTAEMTVTVKRDWEGLINLAHGIGAAIGKWNVGLGETISQVVQLADMLYKISQQSSMSATEGAMAGLGVGMAVGGLGQSFGWWQGDRGKSKFGGDRSGDYGDTGAAIGGLIGGAIGSVAGPVGTMVGAAIGAVIGGVIGGAIKSGADEGLATLNLIAGRVETEITKDEGGLGKAVGGIGDAIGKAVEDIASLIGGELVGMNTVFLKIRDDTVSVFVNGLVRRFEDVDEAISFAVTEALKTASISGMDPLYAQVLSNSSAESLEQLQADINVARTVLSFEIGEVGMAARDSSAELDLLRSEISRLVDDSDQLARSLAAINTEELNRWSDQRDAITGRQKTPKEELAERQRDAEIFNAEKALRIAELEFKQQNLIIERDQLQAEMQLRLADHEMNRGWLEGKARFLEAEIGVNASYATAMSGITSAAIANLNAIIEANAKLIEGLKKIPDIDLKEIRINTGAFGGHVSRFGAAARELADRWERGVDVFWDALTASKFNEATTPYTERERIESLFSNYQTLLAEKEKGNVWALEQLPETFNSLVALLKDYTGGAGGLDFLGLGTGSFREVFELLYAMGADSLEQGRPKKLYDREVVLDERYHRTAERSAAIQESHRKQAHEDAKSQTREIKGSLAELGARLEGAINRQTTKLYDSQRAA